MLARVLLALLLLPQPGPQGGRIALDGPFKDATKDPSFVDDARPVGGTRYIAFGDLRAFFLKAFDVHDGALAFRKGEVRVRLAGVPPAFDSPWAPCFYVAGDQLVLLYCTGSMPEDAGPRWETYRLHLAEAPLAAATRELQGGTLTLRERGPILADGAGGQEAMIDPQRWVSPAGKAFVSYTLVRWGIPGVRPHEEFVRCREVDPADPARALGPERALWDGKAGTADDGVAEAQDLVTLGGRSYAFVSSRAGDQDQRLLVAPLAAEPGPIDRQAARPFLLPGGEPWRARAVGSSAVATIGGRGYMVYQGLDAKEQFSLGWLALEQPK